MYVYAKEKLRIKGKVNVFNKINFGQQVTGYHIAIIDSV